MMWLVRPRRHGRRHRGCRRRDGDGDGAAQAVGTLLWWAGRREVVQGPSRRSGRGAFPEAELESLGAAILGVSAQ